MSETQPLIRRQSSSEGEHERQPLLPNQTKRKWPSSGFLLIAAAQVFFSAANFIAKILQNYPNGPQLPTWELIAMQMFVITIGCYIYLYHLWRTQNEPLFAPRGVRLLLVFRGFAGLVGIFGIYYGLRYISLSVTTSLAFLAPVVTGIMSSIFLREPYTIYEALSAFVSLCGVLLIAKPEFLFHSHGEEQKSILFNIIVNDTPIATPQERTIAVVMCLLGVFGAAAAYMMIRFVGHRASPIHSISYFASISLISSLLIPAVLPDNPPIFPHDPKFIVLFLSIGVLGLIAQVLLTCGLQREKAGRGSLAIYIQLPVAMIFDLIFFRDQLPDLLSISGALLIVISALSVAFFSSPSSSTPSHTCRHESSPS